MAKKGESLAMPSTAQGSAAMVKHHAPPNRTLGTGLANFPASGDRSFRHVRTSEERLRSLIHHLPVALLQVDARCVAGLFPKLKADGVVDLGAYLHEHPEMLDFAIRSIRVIEANHEAMSLFGGTTPASLVGPIGFVFAESPETLRRVIIARFDGKRGYTEIVRGRTFDGRIRDARLSFTFPTNPEQIDVGLLCVEDVTDRLRAERQLRRLQAEFAHAARVSILGELTTSIAHEVNQPLGAIVTNAETSLRLLSREDLNVVKIKQLTTRIAASAQRASDIVQRIRGMAAKHETERAPLDLNEIIDEALLFIRHDIESRSIVVSATFDGNLPSVLGDRIQLQQVVINLLINSVQAIAQGGKSPRRIELRTSCDENGAVAFSIHDNGPGIADEALDLVFDSFFTTKDDGVGIGLAICQSIIVAHGGGITASNHPDGGAEFRFWLPAQAAIPSHPEERSGPVELSTSVLS